MQTGAAVLRNANGQAEPSGMRYAIGLFQGRQGDRIWLSRGNKRGKLCTKRYVEKTQSLVNRIPMAGKELLHQWLIGGTPSLQEEENQ